MSIIKVLKCEPGKKAEYVTIENKLNEFQKIVGGFIETVHIGQNILVVCNEEGKVKGLRPNRPLFSTDGRYLNDIIFGIFFICTVSGEDFSNLLFTDYDKISDKYFYPYSFSEIGFETVL